MHPVFFARFMSCSLKYRPISAQCATRWSCSNAEKTAFARAGRERIPAKGRPVIARLKCRSGKLFRADRADGDTAAKRLGERKDIRLDPILFIGEQRSGASHSGLDLIYDEKDVLIITQLPDASDIFLIHGMNAAFALHQF